MPLLRGDINKTAFDDYARRRVIVKNIISLLDSGDNFLLLGHSHPDDDCISSMIALALIIVKTHKRVTVFIPDAVQENFSYLIAIGRYNSITIASTIDEIPDDIEIISVLDTPKPEMIEGYAHLRSLIDRAENIIEIDHHIAADARYIGEEDYSLVDSASSTCELIGLLAMELEKDENLMNKYQIEELFSRNLVLSLITGIISDTRMGKYLKTDEEKWFYKWITQLFDSMLSAKTRTGSGNLSTKEEVFSAINILSAKEEQCYRYFLEHIQSNKFVDYAVLDEEQSAAMFSDYGTDIFISVAKTIADVLAEKSGYLGLVAFYDNAPGSELVQFRLRRSHVFQKIDLREFLRNNNIVNGGGHPGAIGFRFNKHEITDIESFSLNLVHRATDMVAKLVD